MTSRARPRQTARHRRWLRRPRWTRATGITLEQMQGLKAQVEALGEPVSAFFHRVSFLLGVEP